jgi:hypothetical protein
MLSNEYFDTNLEKLCNECTNWSGQATLAESFMTTSTV